MNYANVTLGRFLGLSDMVKQSPTYYKEHVDHLIESLLDIATEYETKEQEDEHFNQIKQDEMIYEAEQEAKEDSITNQE